MYEPPPGLEHRRRVFWRVVNVVVIALVPVICCVGLGIFVAFTQMREPNSASMHYGADDWPIVTSAVGSLICAWLIFWRKVCDWDEEDLRKQYALFFMTLPLIPLTIWLFW